MKVYELQRMLNEWIREGYEDAVITADRGSVRFDIMWTEVEHDASGKGAIRIEIANPRTSRHA